MIPLRFHPAAQQEVEEATDFLEGRRPGLGAAFLRDLERALARVGSRPLAFPTLDDDLRRALLDRFPNAVIYDVREDRVEVLALAHTRRRPRSWAGRGAD